MTPELTKQIEAEAEQYTTDQLMLSHERTCAQPCYIAGATKYAKRVEELERVVERLSKLLEGNVKRLAQYEGDRSALAQEYVWQDFKQQNNL